MVVAAAEQGTTNIEQRTLRVVMWWGESSLRLKAGKTGIQIVVVAVVVVVLVAAVLWQRQQALLLYLTA